MLEINAKRMIEIDGGGAILRLGQTMVVSQIADRAWHCAAAESDHLYLLSGDAQGLMLERFARETGRIDAQLVLPDTQVVTDIDPRKQPVVMMRRLKPMLGSVDETHQLEAIDHGQG